MSQVHSDRRWPPQPPTVHTTPRRTAMAGQGAIDAAPWSASAALSLVAALTLGLGSACARPPAPAPLPGPGAAQAVTPPSAPPHAVTPGASPPAPAPALAAAVTPSAAELGPPLTTFALPLAAAGKGGAVATAHPLATRAAAQALYRGGNAVDALVAASFTLSVVVPQSTGIGGGGFAIVVPPPAPPASKAPAAGQTPPTAAQAPAAEPKAPVAALPAPSAAPNGAEEASVAGAPTAWDFRETAPLDGLLADYLDADGRPIAGRSTRHGMAVGTPGLVAGLWALHQRYGKLPWAELLQPAIDAADRGFALGEDVPAAFAAEAANLDETARALLAPGGRPLRQGDVLRQPAQAETLRAIAKGGADAFYRGEIAGDIVGTVRARGGKLTLRDLQSYRVRELPPLEGPVFGAKALTMPQPSAGGAQLLAMAELLQRWSPGATPKGRGKTEPRVLTATEAHALAEAMRASFLLRFEFSGDDERSARRLDDVYPAKARLALARRYDPRRASDPPPPAADRAGERHDNTSHISIIDSDGLAVASTQTINLWFGAGIVSRRTGIWLNNELDDFSYADGASNAFGLAASRANRFAPGKRPVSSMTPTVLLDARGKVEAVVGTPGGTRIPTTVLQVLYRQRVLGQDLAAAVAAPRLHHQALPHEIWLEPEGSEWAFGLQALGHRTVEKARWCNVQAVGRLGDGQWQAVADPRGEGGVMVVP